jgi:hypothetical protein
MFGVGHPHIMPEFFDPRSSFEKPRRVYATKKKSAASDIRLRIADARRDPSPGSGDQGQVSWRHYRRARRTVPSVGAQTSDDLAGSMRRERGRSLGLGSRLAGQALRGPKGHRAMLLPAQGLQTGRHPLRQTHTKLFLHSMPRCCGGVLAVI